VISISKTRLPNIQISIKKFNLTKFLISYLNASEKYFFQIKVG
jgi:hypothetical protein